MENFLKIEKDEANGNASIEVGLSVAIKERANKWTVFSPQFKVIGFSNVSKEEAERDFEENLNLFFNIHLERDTLDDALKHFGWTIEFSFKNIKKLPEFMFDTKNVLYKGGVQKKMSIPLPYNQANVAYA
ncbi:hypothetical protein [uncultured Arcticibacterium sp.]|uniref:hypothetical protein n=1 Tax=uncultured Arcticibacterium sp. TaxID=2173042 RepID=UPI0030F6EB33